MAPSIDAGSGAMSGSREPVLRIRDLRIRFETPGRQTTAVSGHIEYQFSNQDRTSLQIQLTE